MIVTPVNQSLGDGIRCLALPDERFKTSRLSVALLLPLAQATASQYAILPFLMRRGCAAYPDYTALQKRLNRLYGATVSADVARLGEAQALVLTASSIDSRYAIGGEDVAAQCAQLLCSMVFEPALENGLFRQADVEIEKRCLAERIQSEINEKRLYARRKCEELLCENEAYAVDRYGTAQQVEALTPQTVSDAWKQALRTARIQLIVQGSGDPAAVSQAFLQGLGQLPNRAPAACSTVTAVPDSPVRQRVERMEVGQCKLVMGFRTGVAEPDGDVMAARLMNALLGGTPHSLLFRNVREKLSLCYYCASSYDRLKGLLLVDSGVEEQNTEKAKEEILRQLEAIRQGNFTQEDLESARLSACSSFAAVEDSQPSQAGWYLGQSLLPQVITPAQAAQEIAAVTRERVMAAAQRVTLGSVYLLAGTNKEKEAVNHG